MAAYAPSVAPSVATSFVDTTVGREYFYEAKECVVNKQYLKAKRLFKFVIQLRPDAASPHYHLGCVLVELNCLQEAVSHFKKATNIKPEVIKYRQFYKWYSILYHCKYNDGQTPGGGPSNNNNNNKKKNKNNDKEEEDDDDDDDDDDDYEEDKDNDDEDDEEDDDDEDEHESDEEILNIGDITDYNNEYYSINKLTFNRYSIHRLLKEFCPSKYHLTRNATNKQTLNILKQVINLYDPKNNSNCNEIYYKYNTRKHPNLNQKHLYQLLIHQKDLLQRKIKENKNKKKLVKNSKKYDKCPFCFVPLSMICEHQRIKKGKNKKGFNKHKYRYFFEENDQ